MKYLLLLILIPQFAIASALVIKDDLNKIFNVIAVLDFPLTYSESSASTLTNETDLFLNNLQPEVLIGGETWTVLFNLDYQIGEDKYPRTNSCAHNTIVPDKNLKSVSFIPYWVSSLGIRTTTVTLETIIKLPFESLTFEGDYSCFGTGSPESL